MNAGRHRLAALGRVAALLSTAAVLGATSTPSCLFGAETSTWAVETSCGPAGTITLAHEDPRDEAGCSGRTCWAFVEAPEANAVGLPQAGEVSGAGVAHGDLALVGPVPLAGASPPVVVERTCRFTAPADGTLEVTCTGDVPEAACEGTLTRIDAAEGT